MNKYIAILRGINVGGQRKILMADLKKFCGNLGFTSIATYIQSGNIAFEAAETDTKQLQKTLENGITEKYGFQVPVIVLTKKDLEETLKNNPFLSENDILIDKLHVTFLKETPQESFIETVKSLDFGDDRFHIIGKNVYIYCPESYGNSKLTNSFFETKLKVKATTRNWKTVNILSEMLEN